MAGRVEGKVVLITGAARGQGRSHALTLAGEGADVILVDLLQDYETVDYPMATAADLQQTVKDVEALGRRVVAAQADVRHLEELQGVVNRAVAELGRLDVVCANAGICTVQPWDQVTSSVWQDTLDTNLTGVWNTMVAAVPHLIAGGGGSIIATSSVAGLKGQPYFAPYIASKHGVVGIARSLANELAKHRIRVNTIHPTGVDTDMATGLREGLRPLLDREPEYRHFFINAYPVDIVQSEDVSNAVLFLASEESRYITGCTLTIDAGITIK
jgi:SDR family mycofactocin-dependent oxidoreductase